MFTELRSLLAIRSITITVAGLGEDQIRVNVIPHSRPEDAKANEQIKHSHKDEVAPVPETAVKALTTPISLTGTAEEIDQQLSDVLLRFVESHVQLQATFDRAGTEISEAVKAIDERNKNKPKSATTKAAPKNDINKKPADNQPKTDDSLPLWWTTKSVPTPGTATALAPSPTAPADAAAGNHPKNTQEVSR
jgi:PRTRC genetic system protein E